MTPKRQKKLGQLLIEAQRITESQLDRALARQASWGGRLGTNLVMTGAIQDEELLSFLAAQTGIPEIHLDQETIEPEAIEKIPQHVAEFHNLIPVRMTSAQSILVAFADPTDLNAVQLVEKLTQLEVERALTTYSHIMRALQRHYLGGYPIHAEPTLADDPPSASEPEPPMPIGLLDFQFDGGLSAYDEPRPGAFGHATSAHKDLEDPQAVDACMQKAEQHRSRSEADVPPAAARPKEKSKSTAQKMDALEQLLIQKGILKPGELEEMLDKNPS